MNYGNTGLNTKGKNGDVGTLKGGNKPLKSLEGLKGMFGGELTQVVKTPSISESMKETLGKMGIQVLQVVRSGLDYVVVSINGNEEMIQCDVHINGGSYAYIQRTNHGYKIMNQKDINEAKKFAMVVNERQKIVNDAMTFYKSNTPGSENFNKPLYNNFMRDKYEKSNSDAFFNTVVEGETLVGKIGSIKDLNQNEVIVFVNFNNDFYGKIRRPKDEMYDRLHLDSRDIKLKIGDYCLVKVKTKENYINPQGKNIKNVFLGYVHE